MIILGIILYAGVAAWILNTLLRPCNCLTSILLALLSGLFWPMTMCMIGIAIHRDPEAREAWDKLKAAYRKD